MTQQSPNSSDSGNGIQVVHTSGNLPIWLGFLTICALLGYSAFMQMPSRNVSPVQTIASPVQPTGNGIDGLKDWIAKRDADNRADAEALLAAKPVRIDADNGSIVQVNIGSDNEANMHPHRTEYQPYLANNCCDHPPVIVKNVPPARTPRSSRCKSVKLCVKDVEACRKHFKASFTTNSIPGMSGQVRTFRPVSGTVHPNIRAGHFLSGKAIVTGGKIRLNTHYGSFVTDA